VLGRRVIQRAGWSFADQALNSGTNFALSVVIARNVGAAEFGAFGLVFSCYLLAVGFTRAVAGEPLLVRASVGHADMRHQLATASTGTALVIGLLGSAACVVGGIATSGPTHVALLAFALLLPGLLVQDTLRHVSFAAGRPRDAFANDAVWGAAQLIGVVALFRTGHVGLASLTVAWGLGATAAAVWALAAHRLLPAPTQARPWLRRQRDLVPAFVGEFATRNASTRLVVFVVAATAGLDAVAGMRAAQVITGPATVLLLGAGLVTVPEAVRLHERNPELLPQLARRLTIGFGLGALAIGATPLLLSDEAGTALLGASWEQAKPVLLPQALLLAAMGATTGWATGLRALGAARSSLGARLVIAPIGLGAGAIGAVVDGAAGAVYGLAAVYLLGVAVWRRQFVAAAASSATTAPPTGAHDASSTAS